MTDFFLNTLSAEAWLGIAVVVILLAAVIYYFFEIGELELGIPPKVKLTRRVRSRAQSNPPPAPPPPAPATLPSGVNVSGGALDVKGDVIGGGVTKRDEYIFPNSNVTINQPAAPIQPPPTPLAYAPPRVAPIYIARHRRQGQGTFIVGQRQSRVGERVRAGRRGQNGIGDANSK